MSLMECTDDLSNFMTFVGTINILVYSVHCPVEARFPMETVFEHGNCQESCLVVAAEDGKALKLLN